MWVTLCKSHCEVVTYVASYALGRTAPYSLGHETLQLVENALDIADHRLKYAGTTVVRPVPLITDDYIDGAFGLHLHAGRVADDRYFCAVSQQVVLGDRFGFVPNDRPPGRCTHSLASRRPFETTMR